MNAWTATFDERAMMENQVTEGTPVELKLVRWIIGGIVSLFIGLVPMIWYAAGVKAVIDHIAGQMSSVVVNDQQQSTDIAELKARMLVIDEFGSKSARAKLEEMERKYNLLAKEVELHRKLP